MTGRAALRLLSTLRDRADRSGRVDVEFRPRGRIAVGGHVANDRTFSVLAREGWLATTGYEGRWLLRDDDGYHVVVHGIRRAQTV